MSKKKSDKAAKSEKKKGKSGKKSRSDSAAPETTGVDTTAIQDKRRTKLRTAREAATAAAELARLDEQLEVTNAELRELDARRAAAEQRLVDLHNSIGAAQLTKARIRSERKRARGRAVAARDEATGAERKYDSAVLSQLLDNSGLDRSEDQVGVS